MARSERRWPRIFELPDQQSSEDGDRMKIAILGTRGIPANYGGFETFAEELSTRLVQQGHVVTVYGRSNNVKYAAPVYRGVQLVILPTIASKHLDTPAHTLLSVLHALFQDYDVILMCNAANAIFSILPRLVGVPVALNVDGIERRRSKWGLVGRTHYRLSEYLSTLLPTIIISDAAVIEDYFLERYGTPSVRIAYGADCRRKETTEFIEALGLGDRGYLLYVSRLEPENNAHVVIEAYRGVETSMPLVIVGDAPYAADYIRSLKRISDERVLFTGAIYGDGCLELRSHAYLYVQASEVGGTHPALLEAMGAGNCVLAKDTPEHREVLDSDGLYFNDVSDLQRLLERALSEPDRVAAYRKRTRARVQQRYSWDAITLDYETLFRRLTDEGPRNR
jgi:glycosyltransferase involved in cell wall biosynthesis